MEIAIDSAWSLTAARIRRNIGYEQLSYGTGAPSIGEGDSYVIEYSRSAPATGKGRSSSASINRNADVHAPIASARDRIAALEVTFRFRICRQPKMASARSESSQPTSRKSRLSSRICSAGPNALRTSAGSRPSAIPSARWDANSSSISRFNRPLRNVFLIRDQSDMSHRPEDPVHCRSHGLPARYLVGKLLLAFRSQAINPQPPRLVFVDPLGLKPARLLHPVKRGVERTLVHPQYLAGPLFDRRHDGVAMQSRPPGQNLQNEQIKRALEGVGPCHIETSEY